MSKSRITYVYKKKHIHPRKEDSSCPKISSSVENIDLGRKVSNKSLVSPYVSSPSLNFATVDEIHRTRKHKSLKMISKIIPDIEKKNIKMSKSRQMDQVFLSDSRAAETFKKDSISKKVKDLVRTFKDSSDLPNKREIYEKIFIEVISYNKDLEPILVLLLKYYSNSIKNQRADLKNYLEKYESLQKQKEEVLFENNNLYFLNNQLQEQVDQLKKKLVSISDKLIKISKIEFSDKDFNEENWKKMLQANNMYEEALVNLRDKVKYYKNKAKKMVKLLTALENKGFPVQDVYVNEVNKKKSLPRYQGNSEPEDDTDNENIVSGKAILKLQPKSIPKLNMEQVPLPSFSSIEEDTSKSEPSSFE